ncbi:MAG: hypothetical protein ACREIT_09555 [Tepidisphaeraceae bacterium]
MPGIMGLDNAVPGSTGAAWSGRAGLIALSLVALASGAGCQAKSSVSARRLLQHQAVIDFSGLKPVTVMEDLKVRAAAPEEWTAMPFQHNALFAHQQWKSPSTAIGIGVVHVKMPLPFGARTVIWFAKAEYTKRSKHGDGRLIGQWTDGAGREWFEAENAKYHVKGYAVTHGFDAWLVYTGARVGRTPSPGETGIAARCADTVLPIPVAPEPKSNATASGLESTVGAPLATP